MDDTKASYLTFCGFNFVLFSVTILPPKLNNLSEEELVDGADKYLSAN